MQQATPTLFFHQQIATQKILSSREGQKTVNWLVISFFQFRKNIGNISEVEISVPSNLHKSLMDPKDCLVDAIMEECGSVHILFPNNSGLQRVIFRGPAQSVEKAKKKLLQLAEEQKKSYSVVLHVKPQYKFLE